MTSWTRDFFSKEAKALFLHDTTISSSPSLRDWRLVEQEQSGAITMIQRSPLLRPYHCGGSSSCLPSSYYDDNITQTNGGVADDEEEEGEDYYCLSEDDTILVADDTSIPIYEHDNNLDVVTAMVLWHLSIVPSDTWQCPVLYFRLELQQQQSPQQPIVSRDYVLNVLQSLHHQNSVPDAATTGTTTTCEFVSYDEHPMTGIPCFFLHPCQTRERLQILNHHNNSHNCPQSRRPRSGSSSSSSSGFSLLQWMSLILPAVGLSIPAKEFVSIQKQLEEQEEDRHNNNNNNNNNNKTETIIG